MVGIFTNADLLGTLAAVASECPTLKHVIYDGDSPSQSALDKLRQSRPDLQILTLAELMELGKKEKREPVPPTQDDICCIMYTSGSTGAPKGVILSHRNVCASVAAVHFLLKHLLQPDMTYIGA